MMRRRLTYALFGAFLMIGALGCEQDRPFERAGEEIDETAEKAGDAVEDAADRIDR